MIIKMEPKAKRSKPDDGVFVLNKLRGRIVLQIKGFSKCQDLMPNGRSKPVRIRGIDWVLKANAFGGPNKGFEFYIERIGGSRHPIWNCAVSVILLCTSGGKEVEMARKDNLEFDETSDNYDFICKVAI